MNKITSPLLLPPPGCSITARQPAIMKKDCAAGTYKPAYGNQIGLCLPCPAGTYSDTVGATSQSDCKECPLGFYGASYGLSSVTGCMECPAGTFGAVQGGRRLRSFGRHPNGGGLGGCVCDAAIVR